MFTKTFWTMSLERAIKSFAQTFVAMLGVQSTLIEDAPWYSAASTAAVAFVLSIMTSIGSLSVGPDHDPSVVAAPPGHGTTGPPPGPGPTGSVPAAAGA
jgi:hypothetical protein